MLGNFVQILTRFRVMSDNVQKLLIKSTPASSAYDHRKRYRGYRSSPTKIMPGEGLKSRGPASPALRAVARLVAGAGVPGAGAGVPAGDSRPAEASRVSPPTTFHTKRC